MKKLATIISRIFEPMVVISVLTVVGALYAGLQGSQFWSFFLVVLVLAVIPVTIFRVWLFNNRRVDWDIIDRRKRIVPLLLLLGVVAGNTWIVSLWQNREITYIFAIYLVWLVGLFLITLRFKISGHTSTIALASLLVIKWFGLGLWPLLFTIPVVAWARVTLHQHTPLQTFVGAMYSVAIFFLF